MYTSPPHSCNGRAGGVTILVQRQLQLRVPGLCKKELKRNENAIRKRYVACKCENDTKRKQGLLACLNASPRV